MRRGEFRMTFAKKMADREPVRGSQRDWEMAEVGMAIVATKATSV
jgi:hypothetical protein